MRLTVSAFEEIMFLLFLAFPLNVWSQNVGFVPGDAFFSTYINEESQLDRDGRIELVEDGANREKYFSGTTGFNALFVEGNISKLVSNLRVGMRKLRRMPLLERRVIETQDENGKVVARSLNQLQCLIYSKNFDTLELPLGLRFNEHWIDPTDANKSLDERSRYQCEWIQSAAVTMDWLYAKRVLPLEVDYEKDLDYRDALPKTTSRVVRVKVEKIKMVLMSPEFFAAPFNQFVDSLLRSEDLRRERESLLKTAPRSSHFKARDFDDEARKSMADFRAFTWIEVTDSSVREVRIGDGQTTILLE